MVPFLAARLRCRDGPDNPESTTDEEAKPGKPEGYHHRNQVAGEAEERNEHAPREVPSMRTVSNLLPVDDPPEEIIGEVDQDKKSSIRGAGDRGSGRGQIGCDQSSWKRNSSHE